MTHYGASWRVIHFHPKINLPVFLGDLCFHEARFIKRKRHWGTWKRLYLKRARKRKKKVREDIVKYKGFWSVTNKQAGSEEKSEVNEACGHLTVRTGSWLVTPKPRCFNFAGEDSKPPSLCSDTWGRLFKILKLCSSKWDSDLVRNIWTPWPLPDQVCKNRSTKTKGFKWPHQ